MLPLLVKNWNMFAQGRSYAGRVKDFTPPKLSRKLEEIMAAGMSGVFEADMGLEKMETSFSVYEWSPQLIGAFGMVDGAGFRARFTPVLERDDESAETVGVECEIRGRIKIIDHGSIERGKEAPMKVEMAVTYYRYQHDGKDIVEIDIINMIEKYNGVDRLAAQRAAMGI